MMNKEFIKSKRCKGIIFFTILILQLACMIHFGKIKEGFHMDEIYSYGLSNSYYKPFLRDTEKWLNHTWFDDYLQVGKNDAFKYKSVYYNQTRDVHPPLFYFVLHTICSFNPNTFTKWTGIGLNLAFFIGAAIALFFLSKKVLKNDYLAMAVCSLWGFSIGAIGSVIYVRMYVMLTFWVILITYIYIKAIKAAYREKIKLYLLILAIGFLGTLTQYYFLIFHFFVAGIYFIYCLLKKQFSDLIKFSTCAILSIVLAVAFFPKAIDQTLNEGRGKEALSSIGNLGDYIVNLKLYLKIVNNTIFAGLLLFFIVIIISVIMFRALKGEKYKFNNSFIIPALIFVPSLFYFIIIAKIAPYQTERYIAPILPLLTLSFIGVLNFTISLIIKNKKIAIILIYLISFLIITLGFATESVRYIYPGYSKVIEKSKAYHDKNCLIITTAPWEAVGNMLELRNYNNIYIHTVTKDKLNPINDKIINNSSTMIVYINKDFNQDKVLNYVKESSKLKNYKKVFDSGYFLVYYFN